jgi:hypothetical protein
METEPVLRALEHAMHVRSAVVKLLCGIPTNRSHLPCNSTIDTF